MSVFSRPVVILEGGPRSGWCYFQDDIDQQRRSAEYFGRRFDYEPTGRKVEHPFGVKAKAHAAEYPGEYDDYDDGDMSVAVWRWVSA